jgi:competence protein ComGC
MVSDRGEVLVRSLIGLVIVLLIVFVGYKLYLSQIRYASGTTPSRTIDVVGVKSDLLAIGQAERLYQVQHNSYGTLDQLVSSGAMSMAKSGRDGYTYEVETSGNSFRVIAHCPAASSPGCTNYAVDETMDVHVVP